jgi:pimeloyl-ACP methyl ester carboxylesterase
MHGTEDRIVSPGSARWAAEQRPDWDVRFLHGVGHIPQGEVPDEFVSLVNRFLDTAVV